MVRISKAKKLAKERPLIQFPEAMNVNRLNAPSGRTFYDLRTEDVEVLRKLGWKYVEDAES
jgi:hypothetical protein